MIPITTRFKQTVLDDISKLENELRRYKSITNLILQGIEAMKERILELQEISKSIKEGQ